MTAPRCNVTRGRVGAIDTVTLRSDLVETTLLVTKGADLATLHYLPKQTDVLWKSPWGQRSGGIGYQAPTSFESWVEAWGGGWPLLFPNGGAACEHHGAQLPFHGEASVLPWTLEATRADDERAEARLSVRLVRSPFRIERLVTLEAGVPALRLWERVTNEAGEPIDYSWTHHPTLGAPFLDEHCRIDTGARMVEADPDYEGEHNLMARGERRPWQGADDLLSRVAPAGQPQELMAYLSGFDATGWYAVTNPRLGFGVGLVWPADVLPYAWMWRELRASRGYPWYGNTYALAVEPSSSMPGLGLARMIEAGTQRRLDAGASEEIELSAVFYEGAAGVRRITADGTVDVLAEN